MDFIVERLPNGSVLFLADYDLDQQLLDPTLEFLRHSLLDLINEASNEEYETLVNLEPKNVTLKDISKFPFINQTTETECSICLEPYEPKEPLKVLRCEHTFHPECIRKWLTEVNVRCPICRCDQRT